MPDIIFGKDGKASFPTKHHGDVTLSQAKWSTICAEPERHYYPFNGDKVATTLVNPDEIRHHSKEASQLFYYKKFATINLNQTGTFTPANGIHFAVVIDVSTKRICTVFPVYQPKPGNRFNPPPQK
jgi:hypothetical protein